MAGGFDVANGEVVLLENCRFNKGEKKNVEARNRESTPRCATFSSWTPSAPPHRAEADHGVAQFAPIACAGLLLAEELDALDKAWPIPAGRWWPSSAAQRSPTKLTVLEALSEKVDQLVVGGGIANTFLRPPWARTSASRCAGRSVPTAKALMEKMASAVRRSRSRRTSFAARSSMPRACGRAEGADQVADDDMIFDIGPEVGQELSTSSMKAGTVVWNGPVGVFEFDQFGEGTKVAAPSPGPRAFAGRGGDTIAAIQKYDIYDKTTSLDGPAAPSSNTSKARCCGRGRHAGTARQG